MPKLDQNYKVNSSPLSIQGIAARLNVEHFD
jgi:hypothetical protein